MFPPRVVLAAVDFSDSSRVALGFAARLAAQTGAALHVLHAEDPMLASAARAAGVDITAETRAELEPFVRSAIPAGQAAPRLHVATGPAVETLCDVATREQADLVVMGVRGMSGAERAMFGSTTEGVLRKADVSVLVVPGTWTPPRPDARDLSGLGPVVAAVDVTEPALAAAAAACQLASALGTSVEAVHVVPAAAALARWSAHAEAAVHDQVEAARDELTSALQSACSGVPLQLNVETGRVADCLAEAVAPGTSRSPILVLGRRTSADRGGAPGTTAYRVLASVAVPVLMHLP
jgi:nucleotide-binding universal stress UspA family protein